jgi:putative toxin-antitoxin system antitoxin component (TIGR02293 family)
MNEIKRNIVTLISKKTGSSEEETNKIITEFTKILKKAARDKRVTFVPGVGNVTVVLNAPFKASDTGKILNIQKAGKWHTDNKIYDTRVVHEPSGDTTFSYSHSARHHILEELKTNRKSDEILERFMTISGMPNKVLAEEIFEISPKTLSSYRKSEKELPIRLNEQILKLEELYKKGIELFENSERFNKWLKNESYGLGNVKPIKLINSITGIDLVFEELVRIEYGTTA